MEQTSVHPEFARVGDVIANKITGVHLTVKKVTKHTLRVKNLRYGTEYTVTRPWSRYVFVFRAGEPS